MLLQTALSGKAQQANATLSIEEWANYDEVKRAMSKSNELVPEAYGQKFRKYRKLETQNCTDFFGQKETYFERWNLAKEVGRNYDKLKQLIQIEWFKNRLYEVLKLYLAKNK